MNPELELLGIPQDKDHKRMWRKISDEYLIEYEATKNEKIYARYQACQRLLGNESYGNEQEIQA